MASTEQSSRQLTISAVVFEGVSVADAMGRPASLAVIDQAGVVVATGPAVAQAVWDASVEAYRTTCKAMGIFAPSATRRNSAC